MKTYFEKVNCIEELKKQYFALAKTYHSDITGGSDEAMKIINSEYDRLFRIYKDIHQSVKEDAKPGDTYKAAEPSSEAPADFRDIIEQLLNLSGLEVELCSRWLWIGGDSRQHKDTLKALGCRWSSSKGKWYWRPASEVRKKNRHKMWDMEEIRGRYGSALYENNETLRLAGI